MSSRNIARRTKAEIAFGGVDITKTIQPYLLSVSYTDNEEEESDSLQIKIQDRDDLWLQDWLEDVIEAASAEKLEIDCVFVRENWLSDGSDEVLPCGLFELDNVSADSPPNTISIKGTSLPFSGRVRQTKKCKAWESYTLSGIANEMAGGAGMTCMYESDNDPYYERVEQIDMSDIAFLSKLCHDAGISLKATSRILVLFDQHKYEQMPEVRTIRRRDGSYKSYSISTGSAETQYASCRVSYVDPDTGQCIEGIAKTEDYNSEDANNQQLEISAKVETADEAKELAEKRLRERNKYCRQARFTLPGDTSLVAGVTVQLERFGGWDGKYIIKQAVHKIDSSSGYTTQITLRRALEGY